MSIIRLLSITVIVFISYVLIHLVQLQIYSGNFLTSEFNTIAYSIYIPHGWRLLAFLIYGYWAVPGLFFAHLYTGFISEGFVSFDLTFISITLISTLCVPLGALIIKNIFKNLDNSFKPTYIISLTLISAFINASLANILRLLTRPNYEIERFLPEFLGYVTGDTLGVVLIVFGYIGIKRLFFLSVSK
ncbi:hypothetical protein [Candidatus Pelagibacter sp.]|uniref:hypothetical protein n=1 Tax=Candidatus Pelagibacter sp. TaxID=2024849 RepID=UPI003D0DCCC5